MKWEEAQQVDSNLMKHALRELELVGYGPGQPEYDGMNKMITEHILGMIYLFSEAGHSGTSGNYTIGVLNKLLRFENLTDITNNPDDWIEVGHDMWQNRRNGKLFSADGGKHYWDIDDNQRRQQVAEEYLL